MIGVYGSEVCGECAEVKQDLEAMSISYQGCDAESLFDFPVDPDIISSIIADAKGRLPLVKIGKRVFACVGEIDAR